MCVKHCILSSFHKNHSHITQVGFYSYVLPTSPPRFTGTLARGGLNPIILAAGTAQLPVFFFHRIREYTEYTVLLHTLV